MLKSRRERYRLEGGSFFFSRRSGSGRWETFFGEGENGGWYGMVTAGGARGAISAVPAG